MNDVGTALSSLRRRGVVVVAPLPPPTGGQTACAALLVRALENAEVPTRTVDLARPFRPQLTPLQRAGDALTIGRAAVEVDRAIRHVGVRPLLYVHLGWSAASMFRDQLLLASPLVRRVGIVGHVHGGLFRQNFDALPKPARLVHRSLLRKLAGVIVLTEGLRGMFQGLVQGERVEVVENAVEHELAEFAARLPERLAPGQPLRVLFLAHLTREKGYEDLLRAAAETRRRGLPITFTLAGGRTERTHVDPQAFISEHCPDVATWVGAADASTRTELLRSHDVFVLPSRVEGVPLALLEALHAGLPVITTPVGGIPETIEAGSNGFLVDPRQPNQIADRLQWLLEHPTDYAAMSARNRQLAQQRFGPDRHQANMLTVLDRIATEWDA